MPSVLPWLVHRVRIGIRLRGRYRVSDLRDLLGNLVDFCSLLLDDMLLISPTSGWTSRKMSCWVRANSRSSVSKASCRVEMRCIHQKQTTHAPVPTHVNQYAMVPWSIAASFHVLLPCRQQPSGAALILLQTGRCWRENDPVRAEYTSGAKTGPSSAAPSVSLALRWRFPGVRMQRPLQQGWGHAHSPG